MSNEGAIPSVTNVVKEDEDNSSSDGSDSQVCLSDDEDIFEMKACEETSLSADYKKSFLYLKSRAVTQVAHMLRDDPLVPLTNTDDMDSIMDVDVPRLWPSWHCPFKNCTAHGYCNTSKETKSATSMCILPKENHIKSFWSHVWGAEDFSQLGKHRHDLGAVVRLHLSSYLDSGSSQSIREWAFSILEDAIAMKCQEKMEYVRCKR